MSNRSIDMVRACSPNGKAYAASKIGDATSSQLSKIISYWGADTVAKWQSVDSTDYIIDDSKKESAIETGKNNAADKTGYDGSKDHGAWGDAALSFASAGATVFLAGNTFNAANSLLGETASKKLANTVLGKKGAEKAGADAVTKTSKAVGAWVAATLAAAEATKYLAEKPNEEQYKAIMELYNPNGGGANLLGEGYTNLEITQDELANASEEITDLAEEADEINEKANEDIEEQKTLFDFYREQYEALKAKAEAAKNGGPALSQDEKILLYNKLAPLMGELSEGITDINDETSKTLEEQYDTIADYQEVYDSGAEQIAEVQGQTDYAEGFDESTRTMCYVEGAAQTLNATSAGAAVLQLIATNVFGINTPFIALGTYAGYVSGRAAYDQLFKMAPDTSEEIHYRRDVQDFESETEDVYTEELDNFAGGMEAVDDLEIAIPEDMEMPEAAVAPTTDNSGSGADPFVSAQSGNNNGFNPLGGGSGNGSSTGGAGTIGSLTGTGSTGNAGTTGNTGFTSGTGTAGNTGNTGATVGTGNNDDGSGNTRGVTGDGNEDSGNNIPLTKKR